MKSPITTPSCRALCGSLLALVVAACGESSSPGTFTVDGGSDPIAPPAGQLALRVDIARQVRTPNGPGALLLSVTLANGQGGEPVALSAAFFKLQLASGLLIRPTSQAGDASPWVEGTAPPLGSELAGGATYSHWILSFDDDASRDAPVTLTFEAPLTSVADGAVLAGRRASAEVGLEPCQTCQSTCTYLDADPENCGACGKTARGARCQASQLTCVTEKETLCTALGDSVCTDVHGNDPNNCGACGVPAPFLGYCRDGVPSCEYGTLLCSGNCVSVQYNEANCGTCGHQCKDGLQCSSGKCGGTITSQIDAAVGKSCDDICSAAGGTCAESTAVGGFVCSDSRTYDIVFECGDPFEKRVQVPEQTCTYQGIGYSFECTCA